MMEFKKINIVTINLNNKKGLEKTIKSIINQTFFNMINYIVIDGGSTDGSVDIIEKYKGYLGYYVSEKDNGIFHAMNKGVSACNGEYVQFLNSGDNLHDNDVIEKIYNELTEDVVYGDMLVEPFGEKILITDYDFFGKWYMPHPSTFTRVDLLRKKKLREDYKIISDWIYYYEYICIDKLPYKHIDLIVSDFYGGGVSSNHEECLMEEKRYLNGL
jgi:glycosyltransferase involved in cell wall biosynthesis